MSFIVSNEGYEIYPAAASGIDPANNGSAWASGAWSEVVASTAQADYIVGLLWDADGDAFEGEIDIGTGGAGSEAVKSTIPCISTADGSAGAGGRGRGPFFLPFPIAVPTSTRIAVRVRSSSTSIGPRNIRLIYVRQASLVSLVGDAVLDEVVEGSYTLRQLTRLMAAALLGELSGAGTTTIVIRDASDTKTRITATVDEDGNRSALTLDET